MIYSPVAVDGHAALPPFSITLNQGQTYSCGNTVIATHWNPLTHPSGAAVLADKPIAISIKDDSDHNPSGGCYDLMLDQIVPVNILGTDYVAVKGQLNNTGDESVFVMAVQNNTNVYVNGNAVPVATLFAGQSYRIDMDYSREDIVKAMCDVVASNGVWPCYIRPVVLRGYGEAGVNPFNSPTEVYVVNYPWGKYLGSDADQGCDVCVSSWTRLAPNTLPAMAKSGANYMNSQLIKMEAIVNGYAEGIALDTNGYVSEGSGENVFIVRNGVLQTAPLGNSVLPGITRDSVLQIARDLNIPIVENVIPREMLYLADEAFFSGTAAEVTPIRSVDKISVGKGATGPITKAIQKEFYAIVGGTKPDRFGWMTPIPVGAKQPVSV
jgi:branched-chain amino acid aminotransferase